MRFLLLLLLVTGCKSFSEREKPYYVGPRSDHFDGKKFISLGKPDFLKELRFIFTIKDSWGLTDDMAPPTMINQFKQINRARITFVGHSTFLIQFPDVNILTDPIWSDRAGPLALPFLSPKRHHPPGITFEDLPQIDYVLISHSSYYHMDIPTIKKLRQKFNPVFITGLGNCYFLNKIKKLDLSCGELDWDERVILKDNTEVFFTAAKNWSRRTWFDTNKTLWGGFVIRNPRMKIFFAGDTGFSPHLEYVAKKYGGIFDLAILPIGSYAPRWRMENHHMDPEEAVKTHILTKARKSIGMHFNTFQTTSEGYYDPLIALEEAKISYELNKNDFVAPKFGEVFEF